MQALYEDPTLKKYSRYKIFELIEYYLRTEYQWILDDFAKFFSPDSYEFFNNVIAELKEAGDISQKELYQAIDYFFIEHGIYGKNRKKIILLKILSSGNGNIVEPEPDDPNLNKGETWWFSTEDEQMQDMDLNDFVFWKK